MRSGGLWLVVGLVMACGNSSTSDPGPPVDAGPDAPAPCGPDGDCTIAPPYAAAPELSVAADVPRGTVVAFTMASTDSKIYPGVSGPFTRKVSVYVPKQYVNGTAAPLMVVQDGGSFKDKVVPVLDTLIAKKELPAMVVVFADPGPGDGRNSERSYEYDRLTDDYVSFVETELLPAVLANAELKATYTSLTLTSDPEGRAAMGASSGGAAAFTMGWRRPDLYHRILTYSGSFVNLAPTEDHPHGAWEYHERLIAAEARKPLRVFLEVGEFDLDLELIYPDKMHGWTVANRSMAAALAAKSYPYRFIYALGVGHVDQDVVGQTIPDALRWVWRGYPL